MYSSKSYHCLAGTTYYLVGCADSLFRQRRLAGPSWGPYSRAGYGCATDDGLNCTIGSSAEEDK